MKILHIVRDQDDARPLDVARSQQQDGHQVSLLLLHDGVLRDVDFAPVVAGRDDVQARGGGERYPLVDCPAMVRMIFENDRVVSW